MTGAFIRLRALIIKELLAVVRDPRSRMILIVPPVIQLLVFAFAATMDVKRIDAAVVNQDAGHWGTELVQRVQASPSFRSVQATASIHEAERGLVEQDVIAIIHIGPTFSRDIERGEPARVQLLLDGRKSNAAQIVAGYVTQIVAGLSAEAGGHKLGQAAGEPVALAVRNWFNPNLDDKWYMVPSLIAVIALLMGLIVTALSIARERELGTFDQLMVSPLRTHEILIGKVIPPMLICLCHITLYVATALFIFGIPFRGNILLLYGSALFFLFSVVGVGLFISAASATQQQAILGAFAVMVPAMLLSGFTTPIENMPEWLQPVTLLNPIRYFLIVVKGVFLKDLPFAEVAANTWPLFLIGLATTTAAAWLFRRRTE